MWSYYGSIGQAVDACTVFGPESGSLADAAVENMVSTLSDAFPEFVHVADHAVSELNTHIMLLYILT